MLVHVAIALVGLMAFSAFVIDYGVMWAARRQAQNAADAAALAGAISLAYVDFNNQDLARQSALAVAAQNEVWGEAPDITAADVTFPACPPGSPGAGTNSCIRVDVFRNQRAGGNPLPTFFGKLVGVDEQGVRATATAEALFGNSTDCVKPFAIPDKWLELRGDVGAAGLERRRHASNATFRTARTRARCSRPTADAYPPGSGYSPEVGCGRRGRSRPLHHPQERRPARQHHAGLVSSGGRSTRRRGRAALTTASNIATCDHDRDRARHRARRRARQHDRADQARHAAI